jgi:hypothetical protein
MSKEEEAIELLVEAVVAHIEGPPGPLPLITLRAASKALICLRQLPMPDDVWLDKLIIELAEFHDRALDTAAWVSPPSTVAAQG